MNARALRCSTRWKEVSLVGSLSLLLAVAPPLVSAQTFLPNPVEQTRFVVQLEKPFLVDAVGLAGYSSILEVDALIPMGSASLQIGLPVAFAGADFVDGTSVYMGNVRANMLFGPPGRLTSFIGITLPTASNVSGPDLAVLVGVLPWLGELEKWIEDSFAVSAATLPSWSFADSGLLGLRLGGAAIVSNGFGNLNVDARVAGWLRVPAGGAELSAELATSYMVTSDDGFGEQFTAYLDLGAALVQSARRPMIFLRVPLDGDGRQIHDLSVGFAIGF